MRILILCTGNSCRSQMAHGLLQSFDSKLEVFSAGTKPAEKVNPMAVKVMTEIGIDLAQHTPKSVNLYVGKKMGLCYYGLRWCKRKLSYVYW